MILFMFLWGLWFVIGHVQLGILIMGGGTVALTTIGRVIIFLVLLKIVRKVSTCVRMVPVKSFVFQTTHSKVMAKNPKLHICLSLDEAHRFRVKILAASVRHRIRLYNMMHLGCPPICIG